MSIGRPDGRPGRSRAAASLLLGCAVLAGVRGVTAAGPEDLGTPRGYLTDAARALGPGDAARIEAYLGRIADSLGVQFAVVLVPTTAPLSIEEYAVRLFQRWGVGDRERDEGLLLLVAVADRAVRFEVGYGLEGALPDGCTGSIIRSQIIPAFRSGDLAAGIQQGLGAAAASVAAAKGERAPAPPAARTVAREGRRDRQVDPMAVVIAMALAAFVLGSLGSSRKRRHGRRGRPGDFPWYGGGLGGPWSGGGFGGGGFGGLGGGFGGGGGGFGGFGGGMSGGGGATGRW